MRRAACFGDQIHCSQGSQRADVLHAAAGATRNTSYAIPAWLTRQRPRHRRGGDISELVATVQHRRHVKSG